MIEAEKRIREALATLCDFKGSIVSYDAAEFAEACNPLAIRDVLAVRDEREARLTRERDEARAERDAILQAITDPENQPSQYGTVTLVMYETVAAERDALAKDAEARG